MKKFITKTLSMILMLAITLSLSITAMAAGNARYTGTAATYEANPNYHAYVNYLNANNKSGSVYAQFDVPPCCSDLEDPSDETYYYKNIKGYYSPIGAPIATYRYLVSNVGYSLAGKWLYGIKAAALDADDNANSTAIESMNAYLDYMLTGSLDNDFAYMQTTYDKGGEHGYELITNATCPVNIDTANWATLRADYIAKNTANVGKDVSWSDAPWTYQSLVPLEVVNDVNAFVKPIADAIEAAIPEWGPTARIGLYKTNLYPTDHELSVTNGRTISPEKAVEVAKRVLSADTGNIVDAINKARNSTPVAMMSDATANNGIATTQVTITTDGKPASLTAVILNNKNGSTTYFSLYDLAPIMDSHVSWGIWTKTDPRTKIETRIGEGMNLYANAMFRKLNKSAVTLNPNRDSRTSVVTINRDVQLEVVVIDDPFYGKTTYYKLRDIAGLLNYKISWSAKTGISLTDMNPDVPFG